MKTVIITGASGNLGQAVVKKFLAEQYVVCGTVIPNDPVVIDIEEKNFEKIRVDLQQEEKAKQFIEQVIARQGKIDVAVLTVGGFTMGDIAGTNIAAITGQYKLNFETAYHVARPVFIQMMKQGSGRIFLIGSRPGLDMKNSKGMVAYGLTKSLIFRLAELMNEEAKGTDLVTFVIVPSAIDTPQNRASMPDADFSKWQTPGSIADKIFLNAEMDITKLQETVIKW